eukprot:scaffold249325_cov73-Cyclotella_meneghiniana.AAC.6
MKWSSPIIIFPAIMCQAFHLGNVQTPISAKVKQRSGKGTDNTLLVDNNTPFHRLMSCNELGQSTHFNDVISRAAERLYLRHNCVMTTSLIVAAAASVTFSALPVNAITTSTFQQHRNKQHSSINTVSINSFWVVERAIPQSAIKSILLPNTDSGARMGSATPIYSQETATTKSLQQTMKPPSLPNLQLNQLSKIEMVEAHANPVKKIGSYYHPHASSKVIKQTSKPPPLPLPPAMQTPKQREKKMPIDGQLKPIDADKITNENQIEVELELKDRSGTVKIDRETFQKVKIVQPQFLQYLPSSMQPLITRQFKSLQVLKEIPDDQLFEASVLAGSLTEMVRSTLTYPLGTVKARVQSRRSRNISRTGKRRSLLRKLRVTWLTFVYETKQGVKEVSRRAIAMGMQSQMFSNLFSGDSDYVKILSVNLLSALVADVASLAVRTPADILGKSNWISNVAYHNHSLLTTINHYTS